MALTAWSWEESSSKFQPKREKCRSIFSACSTHSPPLWSQSDQKTATQEKAVALEEDRHERDGEERAVVDREVEPADGAGDEVLVAGAELVADVGGHAGLDATRTEGDEPEAEKEAEAGRIGRQRHATRAVDERNPEDGAVLAPEGVGHDGAEHGEKVVRGDEEVVPVIGLVLVHRGQRAGAVAQVLRHVDDQNGAQAVEAEALGGFVADDIGNARGHLVRLERSGEDLGFSHGENKSFSFS